MRIKTLVLLLACVIATKSFAQQKSESKLPIKYDVSGTLTGYKSPWLYFELLGIQSLMKLDSVKNQGGKFTFKFDGGISEPGLFRIRAGKDFNTTLMFVVSEKHNNITIQGDSASVANHTYKISGSKASEQMRVLLKDASAKFAAVNEATSQAGNPNLSEAERSKLTQKANDLSAAQKKYFYTYTDTVKNPVLTIFSAISFLNPEADLLQMKKIRQRLNEQKDTFGLAKQFKEYVSGYADAYEQSAPKATFNPGDELPDIALKDTSGNIVKLSSLRGKYVLVDFWASWCGPCRAENPNIVEAYHKFKDKGFTVFGVSLDSDRNRWVKAIKSDRLAWSHVSELKGWKSQVCTDFSIFSIPSSFLIDPQGKIVGMNLRGQELHSILAAIIP